jgi:hypothetical protein
VKKSVPKEAVRAFNEAGHSLIREYVEFSRDSELHERQTYASMPRNEVRRRCIWTLTTRMLFMVGADSTSQSRTYFLLPCLWQCLRPLERERNGEILTEYDVFIDF